MIRNATRARTMGVLCLLTVAGCGASESLPVFNPFDTVDAIDCGTGCDDPGTDRGPLGRDPGPGQDPGPLPIDAPDSEDAPLPADPGPDEATRDPGPGDPGGTDLGPACTSTANCALGELCLDGHCTPGCQSERDCPDGTHCDAAALPHGACRECLVDDDCAAVGFKCVDGTCASVCATDPDCASDPALPRCSKPSGVCVACLEDSDCAIGNVCESSHCVAGCRGDRDCVQPKRCDPLGGTHGSCVDCLESTDCASPRSCKDGACVIDCGAIQCPVDRPRCLPATGACVACTAKADCGAGKVCSGQQCVAGCEGDLDCTGGWHCKAGGTGTCVQCLLDGQCGGGTVCRNDACVTATPICHQDSECKGGQYCHPILNDCRTIPPQACTPGVNCGFLGLGGKCDPLTRTCIDGCTLGLCGLLGSTTTPICVDGGCYECATSADCPGTQCSLFDRTCNACKGDNDCVGSSQTRCDTTDGKCYGCLSDGQCGVGKRCKPVDRVCVECLTAADCKVAGKPVCGKDGTCIATCANECTTQGDVFCVANNPDAWVECGDWDNDPCLEIGSEYGSGGYACPPVQQCDVQPDGIHGKCVCHNECSSGQSKCDASGYLMTCDQNSNSGCWYWGTHSCSAGRTCSLGQCACRSDCTKAGATACLDQYTLDTCVDDGSGCLYWKATRCSSTDKCWSPGYCSN